MNRLVLVEFLVLLLSTTAAISIVHSGLRTESTITEPVTVVFEIYPSFFNLESKSTWATGVIKPPAGFQPLDVNLSSLILNGSVSIDHSQLLIVGGDYLWVKFKQADIAAFILGEGIMFGNLTLVASGTFDNGSAFEGTTDMKVTMGGDVNFDGRVNIFDAIMVCRFFGSTVINPEWFPTLPADQNGDGTVNILDAISVAYNFGKAY